MNRIERSRHQILEAASVEFEAEGIEKTSMDKIARRARLTRATLYNLFSGKDEIAAALIDTKTGQLVAEFQDRFGSGEDPFALIVAALKKNGEVCLSYPKISLSVLTSAKSRKPKPDEPSFRRLIQHLIEAAQNQGQLRSDLAPETLMLILLGTYVQYMIHVLVTDADYSEQSVTQLARILCEGLAPGVHRT